MEVKRFFVFAGVRQWAASLSHHREPNTKAEDATPKSLPQKPKKHAEGKLRCVLLFLKPLKAKNT